MVMVIQLLGLIGEVYKYIIDSGTVYVVLALLYIMSFSSTILSSITFVEFSNSYILCIIFPYEYNKYKDE